MRYFYYPTPHGSITIGATDAGICMVAFGNYQVEGAVRSPTTLTNECATQVQEYFAGKRLAFDVPLDLEGTDFQREVWERVRKIPYGSTNTTSDLARALGKPTARRSVGAALAKNPCALLVPDHRVVSAKGKPLGTGRAAEVRAGLLAHEQRTMSR